MNRIGDGLKHVTDIDWTLPLTSQPTFSVYFGAHRFTLTDKPKPTREKQNNASYNLEMSCNRQVRQIYSLKCGGVK